MKSCGFTGHRKVFISKLEYAKHEIWHEVALAVSEGYTRFISGFAAGSDLEFAAVVAEIKRVNPRIMLEAAIPHRGRLNTTDPLFRSLIGQCDTVHVVREEYSPDCYRARNAYIAENSERLVAVFDGRSRSGTAQTMRMADRLGREVRVIRV